MIDSLSLLFQALGLVMARVSRQLAGLDRRWP
jgi:hypothetical protein